MLSIELNIMNVLSASSRRKSVLVSNYNATVLCSFPPFLECVCACACVRVCVCVCACVRA